jgi:SsrA-binding protein
MNQRSEKLIASHPAARFDYTIVEVLEAGMVLRGTEVKSLRESTPTLKEAFVEVEASSGGFHAWLVNAYIAPYSHGNLSNHAPLRKRKLLLHRSELNRLHGSLVKKGLSLVPLKLYWKRGRVKVELGLGRGKKKYDKRQDLKKKTVDREIQGAMKRNGTF